tara:strand:+ start:75 stop:350 length:276 start_codon:yes stop_codon:yes gene_type:complete
VLEELTPPEQPDGDGDGDGGAGGAAITPAERVPVAPSGVEDEMTELSDSQNALLALSEEERAAFLKARFLPFPKLLRWPTAPFFVTARPLV